MAVICLKGVCSILVKLADHFLSHATRIMSFFLESNLWQGSHNDKQIWCIVNGCVRR